MRGTSVYVDAVFKCDSICQGVGKMGECVPETMCSATKRSKSYGSILA